VKLSVVIPARDEAASIGRTIAQIAAACDAAGIEREIVVVDDGSSDGTAAAVERASGGDDRIFCIASHYPSGFGLAVRAGLEVFSGDAVAIMMADGSDSAADLVRYHALLEEGYDCAFGSRFMPGSRVTDYPWLKLTINRVVNLGIKVLFGHGYNDTTNAFKAYRRDVIETIQPLLSNHFNLTVEMPLKAVVRGHSFAVTPISWTNRRAGESKLKLQEMGSRYLFIILHACLEKHLTRGDYRIANPARPLHRWTRDRETQGH
jgi:dolichol-phosphate mannosyltransferase